ncbi:MAG: 23S rRNA (guanosine(2251)-2'-O)-methyltransferase RlmB [Firmicutes bacterium]|nr:23S rRNA (guanosine(2251)-2'-O)-methyltransferase RlmB [Candidatus Colimorpha enterica]
MEKRQDRRPPLQKQHGETSNGSYVIGRNAVMELLKSGRDINKIYVKQGERTGSITVIVAEAISRKIPVVEVEGRKLDFMANGIPHQGVIASAALKSYASVDDILTLAESRGEKPLIIIGDGIEDPQNLGALMRVAECTGAHGIIISKRHAVGLTEAVGRASAGAIEYVPVAMETNLARTVDMLKEKGLWIFAAEAGGQSCYETDMTCPAAVILGSEGFGVSRLLRDKSDYVISIPMYGKINSMNVTSAGAVILCEASRQRHFGTER